EPRRLDAGRLHGRTGLPIRGLRGGLAGLRAGEGSPWAGRAGAWQFCSSRPTQIAKRVWRFGLFPGCLCVFVATTCPRSTTQACMAYNIARVALLHATQTTRQAIRGPSTMKREAGGPCLSAVFVDYDNIYLSLKRKSEEAAKRFAKDAS